MSITALVSCPFSCFLAVGLLDSRFDLANKLIKQ